MYIPNILTKLNCSHLQCNLLAVYSKFMSVTIEIR